ncbi:MAG: PDZ domain-containing protein, partial [Planctomycetota bacterium]
RFYVGFDVPFGRFLNWLMGKEGEFKLFGIGIPRTVGPTIQWGETQYGIGILPLGGYVKMFGQDDNVANLAEERERSKALEGSPDAKKITGPDGEDLWVDRRSYLAKTVPQRMAIISAGVVMNLIFAFVFAWIAFGYGVPQTPATVGQTLAGAPAWVAGLRTGDRITELNGIADPTYKQLREQVMLGDLEAGLPCTVERVDGSMVTLTLRPEVAGPAPRVGVLSASSLTLLDDAERFVGESTPAAGAGLKPGDYVAAVDGEPVASHAEMVARLAELRAESVELTVVRDGEAASRDPLAKPAGGETLTVTVPPNRRERLGVVPTLGPVTTLEPGGPAAEAGLAEGDVLIAVDGVAIGAAPDGEPSVSPLRIDERLSAAARESRSVTLTARRGEESVELTVTPRVADWQTFAADENAPLPLDAIGAACEVRAEVAAVVAGGPAEAAGVRVGDRIVSAELSSDEPADRLDAPLTLALGAGSRNWLGVEYAIQDRSAALRVQLAIERPTAAGSEGAAERLSVTLTPDESPDAYTVDRGMAFAGLRTMRVGATLGERASLAWQETRDALLTVVKVLQRLGGQVSVKAIGGPLTIAT